MTVTLDLDGTLISCEPRQSAVLQAALSCRGISCDLQHVWTLKRQGASTAEALLGLTGEISLAQEVARHWGQMIEEPFWLGIDRVFPGVIEVLGAMKSCGAWLHLLTARSRPEWLFSQLRSLGLTEFVDKVTVVSPREAVEAKAAYLRESKPIAFFGDTETDFKSAGAACVPFFAVTTGQRSRQFLNGKEVPQVFDSLLEAWITAKDTCSSNSKAI